MSSWGCAWKKGIKYTVWMSHHFQSVSTHFTVTLSQGNLQISQLVFILLKQQQETMLSWSTCGLPSIPQPSLLPTLLQYEYLPDPPFPPYPHLSLLSLLPSFNPLPLSFPPFTPSLPPSPPFSAGPASPWSQSCQCAAAAPEWSPVPATLPHTPATGYM